MFKWVAFLSSKRDARVPVPNQYFGAFLDGSLKYRGIELRSRDTTTWVRKAQLTVLNILAQADSPGDMSDYLPTVIAYIERAKGDLRAGCVPLEDLVVRQKLSRALDGYKAPSPAARAAQELQMIGGRSLPANPSNFYLPATASAYGNWERRWMLVGWMFNVIALCWSEPCGPCSIQFQHHAPRHACCEWSLSRPADLSLAFAHGPISAAISGGRLSTARGDY